jgi:glycosyltransferase involved in cell wall biosynthesis
MRKAVAFFNPIFAHYRSALLRELRQSTSFDFFLFADHRDRYGNIPVAELHADSAFTPSPCLRLFRRFIWQSGTIAPALIGNFDAYIFEGDAHYLTSWIGALIARLRGRRVIFWTHGWTRADVGVKRSVRILFYRLGHGLLLYGNRAKHFGVDAGFAPSALYVMYNSLDVDYQRALAGTIAPAASVALRARLFGDIQMPVVIASARLTARKRFDILVRALGRLRRRDKPLGLLVIGDGPKRAELEMLAQQESVHAAFVGAIYAERQLAEFFAIAAVTVSPGDVGLTCMHSLGYGVPVITHDDPDDQMPEWEAIVPGITGDVFRKNNVAELAAAIERWTTGPAVADSVRSACLAQIANAYHPRVQRQMIEMALSGAPAPPAA